MYLGMVLLGMEMSLSRLLFCINLLSALSLNVYLPAIPMMKHSLQISFEALNWFFSIGFFGVFIGKIFFEYFITKTKVKNYQLIFSMMFCVSAGSTALMTASSFTYFIFWRFVLCVGIGGIIGLSFSLISHLNDVEKNNIILNIGFSFFIGIVIAPVLGSYILMHHVWNRIFIMGFLLIPMLLLSLQHVKEKPNKDHGC